MKIVCSTNMPFVEDAFAELGDTLCVDGRAIGPAHVRDATILATRSTTQVDAALLEGSAIRFVGTATIGTDHLDIPYLNEHGIVWCYSPGCNAESVAEYVTTALLCLARRKHVALEGLTLGVIGVGNVGRRVVCKGQALGMTVLQNDPPRQRNEGADGPAFVSLPHLLAESDVVTVHVPLTHDGDDATLHMADQGFFAAMKPGAWFLNAARGPVVASPALLAAIDSDKLGGTVLDTWEGEPHISRALLERVDLGSPHIAGHSFEGKVMGTEMVYANACRFLGTAPTWRAETRLPPPPVPRVALDASACAMDIALDRVVSQVYAIEADDRALREGLALDETKRAAHFDRLRKEYPIRREFRFTTAAVSGHPAVSARLAALGFSNRTIPSVLSSSDAER